MFADAPSVAIKTLCSTICETNSDTLQIQTGTEGINCWKQIFIWRQINRKNGTEWETLPFYLFGKWRAILFRTGWSPVSTAFWLSTGSQAFWLYEKLTVFVSRFWCQLPSCNYLVFRWTFVVSSCCISHLWMFSISTQRATAWDCQGTCVTDMREVTWVIYSSPCCKKCLYEEIIIFCRWRGLFCVQLQVQFVSTYLIFTVFLPTL